MTYINSVERRRRIRRMQELRAMFIDVLGMVGVASAAMLLYVVLMMLSY